MVNVLKILVVTQLVTLASLFLDVPVMRQVMVFVYLSLLPGFLILRILRFGLKSQIDTIMLSVGLSIAFVMFFGLLVDKLFSYAGFSQPLSVLSLSAAIGAALLFMSFVNYRDHDTNRFSLQGISRVVPASLFFGIPLLSIFGAWFANGQALLLMVVAVSLLVALTGFSRRIISPGLYPLVLMVIAFSLLFPVAFISRHLVGFDIFGEFYVFRLTQNSSSWSPVFSSSLSELVDYNGMLSVTVLPTIYSDLLNVPGEWVFKIVYILFYSLVPLALYQTYKEGFGKSVAFLAAFYFALFPRFYMEERRQIIGELFLVLLLFSILNRDLSPRAKRILVIIFGAALVVSHYSISYIFLFSVLAAWSVASIVKQSPSKRHLVDGKTLSSVIVLLILTFNVSWYVFVTPALGNTFLGFAEHVVTSFTTGFASVQTRGETISEFVAPNLGRLSLVSQADYLINKIPYILILVGFFSLVRNFGKLRMQFEYLPMVSANLAILIMALVLPAFAPAFLAHRFFHVALIFLAPVCVLGGITLLKWISKLFGKIKRSERLPIKIMCILFVLIFLLKVGFVSEVTGDLPTNISLSFMRMSSSKNPVILDALYESYVPQQDVNSAAWLSFATAHSSEIYADEISRKHALAAYGLVISDWSYILQQNTTIDKADAYVYLRYFNQYGLITQDERARNATAVFSQLGLTNKIYTNGESDIYRTLGG